MLQSLMGKNNIGYFLVVFYHNKKEINTPHRQWKIGNCSALCSLFSFHCALLPVGDKENLRLFFGHHYIILEEKPGLCPGLFFGNLAKAWKGPSVQNHHDTVCILPWEMASPCPGQKVFRKKTPSFTVCLDFVPIMKMPHRINPNLT